MFANCKSLQSVEIPEGVTHIGDFAFGGCKNLSKVKFPSTLQAIDAEAFIGCQFKSVILPEHCRKMLGAFNDSVKVKRVDYKEQRIIKNLIDFFSKTTTINDLNSEEIVDWLQKYEVKDEIETQEETLKQ